MREDPHEVGEVDDLGAGRQLAVLRRVSGVGPGRVGRGAIPVVANLCIGDSLGLLLNLFVMKLTTALLPKVIIFGKRDKNTCKQDMVLKPQNYICRKQVLIQGKPSPRGPWFG